jgi:hypothetical protein
MNKRTSGLEPGPTARYARFAPVPFVNIRPFKSDFEPPYPDESLLGFVTRALSHTVVKRVTCALKLAGIANNAVASLPTMLCDPSAIQRLATLLKTTSAEINKRVHRSLVSSECRRIDFFGVPISADYRSKRIRRVSPRALAIAQYHRAVWDLRVFSFDPKTKEALIETCPVCKQKLGWSRARGPYVCDRCVDADGLACVDLRDFPQQLVEVADAEALDFVTELVDPDPEKRAAALRRSAGPFAGLSASQLFETAVAFACALAMSSEGANNTLERPKNIEEYKRFTPEILALAGGALMGNKGFTAIADRIRAGAAKRRGYYGVKKELGPLLNMTTDPRLAPEIKLVLKKLVVDDMGRTAQGNALRRADYARDWRYLTIEALAKVSGLPRKNLGWLANSGAVPVIKAANAGLSPRLMKVSDVAPLVEAFEDAMHENFAARTLAVKPYVLADLVERKLIKRLDGPVLGLFQGKGPYYRKSSVEALAAKIKDQARQTPPLPKGMRISQAVKMLGETPIPWAAVIAAITSGRAQVYLYLGDKNNDWCTAVGVVNLRQFARAVKAINGDRAATLDAWISSQTAAEILGINEVVLYRLAKKTEDDARFRAEHGGIERKGPDRLRQFLRADVADFRRRYIFVPEIRRRCSWMRWRDVRAWLKSRGIETAFSLAQNKGLGFPRRPVEGTLRLEVGR